MDIDSFHNLAYNNPKLATKENGLICSWNHKDKENLMLVLVVNTLEALNATNLDLYAGDSGPSNAPALRIALSNGQAEIIAAIKAQSQDLLEIIKRSNPDIEAMMELHPSFERLALDSSIANFERAPYPTSVATKRV